MIAKREAPPANWWYWQQGVVATVRRRYPGLFPSLESADIDWEAWRPLFEAGCAPAVAVTQALSGALLDEAIPPVEVAGSRNAQ